MSDIDGWQPIDTAPDDFDRPGGQRLLRLRNARTAQHWFGRRALFNNTGWREESSNREIDPTHWMPTAQGDSTP